jgi:hypothetical protein
MPLQAIRPEPIAALVLLCMTACANFSSFQTGRTAGKRSMRLGAGLSVAAATQLSAFVPIDDAGEDSDLIIPVPGLEIWARYGLTDTVDLGARLFTLGVSGEVKTQLVGDQKSPFAMSAGIVASYFGFEIPEDTEAEGISAGAHLQMFEATVALYLSYTVLDEWFNFYLAPKYVSRNVIVGATIEETGGQIGLNMDLAGSGVGVAIGRDFSLYLEGGIFFPIGFDGRVYNLALGFDF